MDFELQTCPVAELSQTQKEDALSKVATELDPPVSLSEVARAVTNA